MVEDSHISPKIGEIKRSPEGFTSEPLAPVSPGISPSPQPHVRAPEPESTPDPSEPALSEPAVPQEPAPENVASLPRKPSMPKKKKSGSLLKWLILLAAGLAAISIGSLFWSSPSFSDRDVVLTLEGPDRSTSGEEVTYLLKWENNTRLDLKEMSFRIFYPEDSVVLVDGEPTQPDSEGFTVEQLLPGESGEKEITLFLVGDKGSIKTATVNLIFKAGTLRSAFEKEVQLNTTITDLPVSLSLTAPPTIVGGQPVTYIVDARNETGDDLADLRLEMDYPEGFTVRAVTPEPDGGSTSRWTIDELADGEGTRFTIQGTLSGVQREAKTITAVLKRRVGEQYIDFVRTDSVTLLSSPLLSVLMTVNDSRDYVAHPGDRLEYKFLYSNNSNQNLIGLNMAVQLDGQMFELDKLEVRDGFFDQGLNTVRFSASGVPDFASLAPGKSGTVRFTVPLRPAFTGGGTGSFFVKSSARLSTPNAPTGVEGSEVFAQDVLTTKIATQPSLTQTVTVSGGASPLQVGQDTSFSVDWRIANPGNELRDATVTVVLPPGISYDGHESGGETTYDSNSGRVTWAVGTVPFGVGAGLQAVSSRFQISVRPSSNQAGGVIDILRNAVLSGTDAFTGQIVQSVVREQNSGDVQGLEDDPRVQ